MKLRAFVLILIIYIAYGTTYESLGVAIFSIKLLNHVSNAKLNVLPAALYIAELITACFGYLVLAKFAPRKIFISCICMQIISMFTYLMYPCYSLLLIFYTLIGMGFACIKLSAYAYIQDTNTLQHGISRQLNLLEASFFYGPFFLYLISSWLMRYHPYHWRIAFLFPLILLIIAGMILFSDTTQFCQTEVRNKTRYQTKEFFGIFKQLSLPVVLLTSLSFAFVGSINVWTPLLMYHFTQNKGESLLLSMLTILAYILGRIGCSLMTKFMSTPSLLLVMTCFVTLTTSLFLETHILYLLPVVCFFLGPVLILACALLLGHIHVDGKYYLTSATLTIASVGDLFGVRAIGKTMQTISFHATFVLMLVFSLVMVGVAVWLFVTNSVKFNALIKTL